MPHDRVEAGVDQARGLNVAVALGDAAMLLELVDGYPAENRRQCPQHEAGVAKPFHLAAAEHDQEDDLPDHQPGRDPGGNPLGLSRRHAVANLPNRRSGTGGIFPPRRVAVDGVGRRRRTMWVDTRRFVAIPPPVPDAHIDRNLAFSGHTAPRGDLLRPATSTRL